MGIWQIFKHYSIQQQMEKYTLFSVAPETLH